jgi:iron(III) transport system substrate-binding protein
MNLDERAMKRPKLSRRDALKGSAALALGSVFASPVRAAAPPPVPITPRLVEAATKEAKVVLYSSMDLPVGEKLGKAFEAAYPGVAVQIERSGSERLFQRIGQEFASNIHAADVINSSDASHFIPWKNNGWLAPFVSEDVAKYFPDQYRDPDGLFATSRIWLSSIAYNTNLVKPEDAPTSFADLLDPKWTGKMVKGHPAYSGTIMTATFQMIRELGWDYFEKLSKQHVMQVQSSTDPPKKLSLGERAVMADGNEYGIVLLKEAGQPVEPVYPTEGAPTISGPTGIFASAPHPNAARLFQAWLHTRQTQQFFIDFTAQYSVHAQVQSKPGRRKISDIKLMKEDAAGVEAMTEEIKTRYAKLFRV